MREAPVSEDGVARLHSEDLIEDRELNSVSQDKLNHSGIVSQLEQLISTVPTPSNIALYGPWGSGKSGIANLLGAKIARKKGYTFVRFDAFKYADASLRRNFISAIASGIGQDGDKYHRDLYAAHTTTEIQASPLKLLKLFLLFFALATGIGIAIGGIYLLAAWVQGGDFWIHFRTLSKQAITAGILPATILAALATMATKTFSLDRTLAKPDSDEQFENLFKDLVESSDAERLVIFIDELDRCTPDEVVVTLDTVRTFLGVARCVFIVAADRNVIEEALTKQARQATPSDEVNPYYSTGSAYLDKVFQYQIMLPPLLPQRVLSFAKQLVAERGGVWAEVQKDYVLPVLIPSHVSSPRRVKHLLNTFALTYRSAEDRYNRKILASHPRDTAAALARLTCLRVEFPLFARHLEVDSRLPQMVQALARDSDYKFLDDVSEHARDLARSYAQKGAAPAVILPSGNADGEILPDAAFGELATGSLGPGTRTTRTHNKQLLDYLSRTRLIQGPSRDLVYLQTTGTALGLDGETALSVEQAAENLQIELLISVVDSLSCEEQAKAMELLAGRISIGGAAATEKNEQNLLFINISQSFLALTRALPELPFESVIDTILEAISRLQDDEGGVLNEEAIESAWLLVRSRPGPSALRLRRRIVKAVVESDGNLPYDFMLPDAAIALRAWPESRHFFALNLMSPVKSQLTHAAVRDKLFSTSAENLLSILPSISSHLVSISKMLIDNHQVKPKKAPAVSGPGMAQKKVSNARITDPTLTLTSIAKRARGHGQEVQHEVISILLAIDRTSTRDIAASLLRTAGKSPDSSKIEGLLQEAVRGPLDEAVFWLTAVDVVGVEPSHVETITQLLTSAAGSKSDLHVITKALDALSAIVEGLPREHFPDVTSKCLSLASRTHQDGSIVARRMHELQIASELGKRNLIQLDVVLTAALSVLPSLLLQPPAQEEVHNERRTYVAEVLSKSSHLFAADGSRIKEITDALVASAWMGREHLDNTVATSLWEHAVHSTNDQ